MSDILDPSEVAAQADRGDNGEMGACFQWRDIPLKPFSLHHKNALQRLAWDNLTDHEYAQIALWLLTRTGEEVNALRGEKAVAKALFDATEWAQAQGAHKADVSLEMLEKYKEIKADMDAAESLSPVSRGGSGGNA